MTNPHRDRFPEIKFRMDIAAPGETKTKLLELYNRKLGALMKIVYSSSLNSVDYEDLPAIRDALHAGQRRVEDWGEVVLKLPEARSRALLDAAPIFNVCPVPMQAYILLALGIRSHHIGENRG